MDEDHGLAREVSLPRSGRAIRYREHGDPSSVLLLEEIPVTEPMPGEVLIEMQAAAIHPSDVGLINGSYGRLRELPAVAGREGAGKVIAAGAGVDEKVVGKAVALPDDRGAWQDYLTAKADDLILLPSLVPWEQLAVSILNPLTAWRLLNDFEYLKPGDYVIQNAGNSAVGLSVAQFAERMGVNLISLVRDEAKSFQVKAFGNPEVMVDDEDAPSKVKEITEGEGCVLAFNSIGGRSALRLTKCLSEGGVHVTFGAMDPTEIRFPTRSLIFNDVRFVGFWLDRWKRRQAPGALRNAIEEVLQPLAMTEIRHCVDRVFDLADYKEGLTRNSESRMGKVLLVRDKDSPD